MGSSVRHVGGWTGVMARSLSEEMESGVHRSQEGAGRGVGWHLFGVVPSLAKGNVISGAAGVDQPEKGNALKSGMEIVQ